MGRIKANTNPIFPSRKSRPSTLIVFSASRAFEVEREEAREDFFVGERGRPAVCGRGRLVESPVRVFEPRGALVVEVRERAARELARGLCVARDEARVAHDAEAVRVHFGYVARPGPARGAGEFERLTPRPLGRVEPARAERVQLSRGLRNRL